MSGDEPGVTSERIEREAAAWLVNLRGSMRDQAGFERWYSADPAHARSYDDLLSSWDAMAMLGRAPASVRPASPAGPSRHPRRAILVGLAAALLLMVFAVGIGTLGLFGASPAEAIALASKVGEIRTVRLVDGSTVILDSDSAVSGSIGAASRKLRLVRGRARFVVASAVNAFIVETEAGTVSALASEFDVALADGAMTVGALRGEVQVHRAGADRVLGAGQALTAQQGGGLGAPRILPAAETRWRTGMLSFENARLADVVTAVNRYAIVKIVLGKAAGDLRFTGTIRPARTDEVARMLAATFGLGLRRGADGGYVLDRHPQR